jgi:hypothetical protein
MKEIALDQTILNWAFALCGALGSFVLKSTWDALIAMRSDLAALQASISTNYVRRDDFRDHTHDVKEILVRIEAKIDGKADKQ